MPDERPLTRSETRHAAFTLIELLVVIAVIALLIALLLPALDRARNMALQVDCAARLAQVGIGMHLYAEDHEGKYPRPSSDVGPSNVGLKAGRTLRDHYGLVFPEAQVCPTLMPAAQAPGQQEWGELSAAVIGWNWGYRMGYAMITSLQRGGHDAGVDPPQVPHVASGTSDPSDDLIAADYLFRANRDWEDEFSQRLSAHRRAGGPPLGGNSLFNDNAVFWFDADRVGRAGEGVNVLLGYNYDYFGMAGLRSYYWGVAAFR